MNKNIQITKDKLNLEDERLTTVKKNYQEMFISKKFFKSDYFFKINKLQRSFK